MFKKIFTQLCNKAGESPTAVCLKVGLSNAAYSNWTDSSVPRRATLEAIAEHFGVTVDFLLGKEALESDSVLSDEEKAVINRYRAVNEETRTAIKKILDIPLPSIADDIADTVARFSPVGTGKK